MKHINIPVFIPHLGCPNNCVFCNQRYISGTSEFEEGAFKRIVDEHIVSSEGAEREIAFFGGSFTGIDRALMIRLLDGAEEYVRRGLAVGIRMSTRPDYIDDEIVSILKKYTLTEVELGIQSISDKVLSLSKRGHTAADSIRACKLLCDAGIAVGGQMMTGLPGSTKEDEVATAEAICEAGCASSRIYPTLVFKNTELDEMYRRGEYTPLSLDEAVERSAAALAVFEAHGVKCLRIGLCESDALHSDATYSAGPADPSIGERVISRLFYDRIKREILSSGVNDLTGRALEVYCARGAVSKVVGHKRENRAKLEKEFGIKSVKAIEKSDLLGYNIKVLLI